MKAPVSCTSSFDAKTSLIISGEIPLIYQIALKIA